MSTSGSMACRCRNSVYVHLTSAIMKPSTAFSPQIENFWNEQFGKPRQVASGLQITLRDDLDEKLGSMILEHEGEEVRVVTTTAVGARIGHPKPRWTIGALREALSKNGVALHGADHVFYCSEGETGRLLEAPTPEPVRQLGQADADLFKAFEAAIAPDDLDAAYVELDHWAVFGALANGRLVAAGSMYPWQNSSLADMGVVTLPTERGRGFARDVVRAMAAYAIRKGFHPQFRCQLDNRASAALARSAGFCLYGNWTVQSQE